MATGSTTSGSQATSSMRKPGGMWKVANSSRGDSGPAGGPGLGSAAEPLARRNEAVASTVIQQEVHILQRQHISSTLSEWTISQSLLMHPIVPQASDHRNSDSDLGSSTWPRLYCRQAKPRG